MKWSSPDHMQDLFAFGRPNQWLGCLRTSDTPTSDTASAEQIGDDLNLGNMWLKASSLADLQCHVMVVLSPLCANPPRPSRHTRTSSSRRTHTRQPRGTLLDCFFISSTVFVEFMSLSTPQVRWVIGHTHISTHVQNDTKSI